MNDFWTNKGTTTQYGLQNGLHGDCQRIRELRFKGLQHKHIFVNDFRTNKGTTTLNL